MTPLKDVAEREIPKWDYAIKLPNRGHLVDKTTHKGKELLGRGETGRRRMSEE